MGLNPVHFSAKTDWDFKSFPLKFKGEFHLWNISPLGSEQLNKKGSGS
jgi:hypothetical protein